MPEGCCLASSAFRSMSYRALDSQQPLNYLCAGQEPRTITGAGHARLRKNDRE